MYRLIKSMFLVSALTGLWGCAGIEQQGAAPVAAFDNGDAGLNTALLAQRMGKTSKPFEVVENAGTRFNAPMGFRIAPTEEPALQLRGLTPHSALNLEAGRMAQMENGVRVYRPFSKPRPKVIPHVHYQPMPPQSVVTPAPMPEYIFDDSKRIELKPQQSALDVSYVKIGGGSDIADWQACENQAGGFVIAGESGYNIDPAFDTCMRARGYKPEREAELELAGK